MRPDGTRCKPGEPGELVHRGALVALGYWGDPARTAERFKPAPGERPDWRAAELAVWSGDTVVADEEGYLYFVGRRDEMIKTSGIGSVRPRSRRLLTTPASSEMWSLWGWKTHDSVSASCCWSRRQVRGLDPEVFDRLYAQQAAALHGARVNRGARPPAQITERQIRPEPVEG